jgi:hypothetical protein
VVKQYWTSDLGYSDQIRIFCCHQSLRGQDRLNRKTRNNLNLQETINQKGKKHNLLKSGKLHGLVRVSLIKFTTTLEK